MASTSDTKAQQEFVERALAVVNEKLGARKLVCQLCGLSKWALESQPAYVPVWDAVSGRSLITGSMQQMLPLIALTCKNCGNTLLMNTRILGLNDLEERESQDHG